MRPNSQTPHPPICPRLSGLIIFLLLLLAACRPAAATPQVHVVVEGLLNPVGIAALPDGSLLIAEEGSGENDLSAGVSLLLPDGTIGRFISGLPSGRDSGDLSGVPTVAVSPDGQTMYTANFGAGHLWTLPLTHPVTLPPTPFTPADLGVAMQPLHNVRLVNPFDITFSPTGAPVVSDASGNGVAIETAEGATRFFHRFDPLPDPGSHSRTIEPVPTGITRAGDEYLVTLTGGCPYPPGAGLLVAIDENRQQRTIRDGLNMPIDVAQGPDGALWLLEFAAFTPGASCFSGSGYRQNSGRLSRLTPDGEMEVVLDALNFPGAVLPMPDGSLYVTEIFSGRLLHVTFNGRSQPAAGALQNAPPPRAAERAPLDQRAPLADPDAALRAAIRQHGLTPNPGVDQRESDTPLARLGQALFFDPILSGDQNISCATCHHPALAMADGRVLPIGAGGAGLGAARDFMETVVLADEAAAPRRLHAATDPHSGLTTVPNPFIGQFVPRNSPTILNSALLPVQFWDGRIQNYAGQVTTLEQEVNALQIDDTLAAQALFPLTSLHEMAGATLGNLPPPQIREALAARLTAVPGYRQQFRAIFGDGPISPLHVAQALAAFERRFIFTDAPWDAYLRGDDDALTAPQQRGALLFFGVADPAINCAQCHSGDLFTDMQFHNILAPQLGPGKGHGPDGRDDWGRGRVTFDRRDQYKFRTPGLRNVALTAPYMHSGAYATLADAITHHADVWSAAAGYDPAAHLPPGFYSSVRPFRPERQAATVAPALQDGLPLTAQDVADLVAFLHALTDPAAADLHHFIPASVPSGLPLDPLPDPATLRARTTDAAAAPQTAPAGAASTAPNFSWQWRSVAAQVGLEFRHGAFATALSDDPAAMMGAGLCWLDYDNDGWLDLYLVNSHALDEAAYWQARGGVPANGLFRNENGRFSDVSQASGANLAARGNGCVAADFNGDGWTDIYVTNDGPNALLWNNGDGTFREGAAAAGVAAPDWNSAAVVGDLNGDGWPDLFVASYIDLARKIPRPSGAFPQDYYGLTDYLFLNNGPDESGGVTFREVAAEVGLTRAERGLGALLSDLNGSGALDLYVANDGQPNRLYANEPLPDDPLGIGFRFRDLTDTAGVGDSGSGMGVAGGDWDGDGRFDLFVTNWEAELNALYRNAGDLTFEYSTYRIGLQGLGNNMTGWGTSWGDFDHDTDLDLLVVNGRVPVTNRQTDPELVRFYGNRLAEGFPGQFREWTTPAGLHAVGPLLARGSAVADFDNDGDLDVAINQIGGPVILLRNDGPKGNWLQIAFDHFAPGAQATVWLPDGRALRREVHAGSSYLAAEDPRLHFGLGQAQIVPEIVVRWPDGRTVTLTNVPVNQRLHLSPP